MDTRRLVTVAGAGALGAVAVRRVLRSPQWQFFTMGGTSIADPTAAGWITDFLNASYYARPRGARSVDDLRLAFGILTTRWHQLGGRRLTALDALAFHRAFGRDRFVDRTRSERGRLDGGQLREGGERLIGPWFVDAWGDRERRGWGVAFPTVEGKAAYQPERRLRNARLGPLTPPTAPGREQIWHTYPPVPVPSAERVVELLTAVETWPDYGSEIGRFTPLRSRGLDGQTFEIEVIGLTSTRTPVLVRGYVTVTRLVTVEDASALATYVHELNGGMARFGRDEPPPVPDSANPLVALDLTTHAGHFMGNARNRLVLYEQDGQAYLRAAGTWDPMQWHLNQVYSRAGRYEQHAFWGMESPAESMLHQIARAAEPREQDSV